MENVIVQRYANPAEVGFQGWIEPEDRKWILFVDNDGKPTLWYPRNPETGAFDFPTAEPQPA